jgi:rubrerythrin
MADTSVSEAASSVVKPSYLGLLNAVAVGELGGERLFKAWAGATPDPAVRSLCETVALREAEHARSFAKRIDELGFTVRRRDDPELPDRVAMAKSKKLSDVEKFERLGFAREPGDRDIFSRFFEDMTIDIQTGELLGRYISEERDTGRRLRACYAALTGDAAEKKANPKKRAKKHKG